MQRGEQGEQVRGGGAAGEDAFAWPAAWRAAVVPRRGGGAVSPAEWPGPDAVAFEDALIAEHREWIEQVCAADESDPALVRAVRAYLGGAADPLGAAGVSAMLPALYADDDAGGAALMDAWTVRHGPAFAARAAAETMEVEYWRSRPGYLRPCLRPADPNQVYSYGEAQSKVLRWARHLLSVADEDAYRAALAEVGAARAGGPQRRVGAAFLFPERTDWVDEWIDELPERPSRPVWSLLVGALGRPEQVDRLLPRLTRYQWWARPAATVADGLGTAAAAMPALALRHLDSGREAGQLAELLLEFPSDEAFGALLARIDDRAVQPVLLRAVERYPVRALRLLAAAVQDGGVTARHLLERSLRGAAASGRLPALLERLDPATAAFLRALPAADPAGPVADVAEWPAVLASPPWQRPRPRPRPAGKPRVPADPTGQDDPTGLTGLTGPTGSIGSIGSTDLTGSTVLTADEEPELRWQDGERELWTEPARRSDAWHSHPEDTDWAAVGAAEFAAARSLWAACQVLWQAPVEVMSPLLADWRPEELYYGLETLRPVLAKYGRAAVPVAVRTALMRPAQLAPLLLPVLDVAAARLMAEGLTTRKSVRSTARSWFARHGTAGALLLVPDALGEPGPRRTAAGQALRLIASGPDGGSGAADGSGAEGHGSRTADGSGAEGHGSGAAALRAAVAGRYGAAAAEAVGAVLAVDPLVGALPARLPEPPPWLDPVLLPPLPLRSGAVLPAAAVRDVLVMLALSKSGAPYPGLALVAEACAPGAWPAFCWAVFEEWRLAGMPARESWALSLLGEFGDDGTARRLAPVVRRWPGQQAGRRAAEGLDVLAAIGTDTALAQLHGIAQRVRYQGVRARAREKIAEVALELGLTPDRLADRLVPDLGLAADGTAVLDYGTRTFTVALDDRLLPYVLDGTGRRRAAPPAPAAKDDPELAPAARKRYAALKKELRVVGAEQTARLETAMVTERAWTADEFRTLFLAHPLLAHLGRRLLWTTGSGAAQAAGAFRIAEDRTFADLDDKPFGLPADAAVRLAHPVRLGADLSAWAELFTDYLVIQPFPQLGRPVRSLTADEAAGHRLPRFEGRTVPAEAAQALARRGPDWSHGETDGDGTRFSLRKLLPDGHRLTVSLDPGLPLGPTAELPDQTLREVWLGTRTGPYSPTARHLRPFARLDPVTASEILADLEELTGLR
ncbi:DUF4132 domain-containing protein [Kitasatospora cineracea]|uniref:Uncharacterized protein DUF4132 n=1 Tax=Kitasatospora cineracea TaxID=88074 RepID=A0A8G1UQR3_9ACTN|nr:DUF4132 domain-containing protein [Kitasatospora cineracea]ROR45962.1 uncharacterized protein DUF4132 [Kitasatospora cineracea]